MKHHIVSIDGNVELPKLNFDYDHIQYDATTVEETPDRIKNATIVVTSATKLTRSHIEQAPNLQLISCNGTGVDHVDLNAARERGITVCRVPAQNTESVAEHAFALYFTIRRFIVDLHNVTMEGKLWASGASMRKFMGLTRTNAEETLVVIGYGALGQHIQKIGTALGMRVLLAERKGATETREGRLPFHDALKQGTLVVAVTPLNESTRDMISSAEFEMMQSSAIIVNVGRGGVIDEQALATALRAGQIGGAGTDVFTQEPATKETCPLLDPTIPNLILTPHIAWYSSRTLNGTHAMVKGNIEGFVSGIPQNVVVGNPGP